MILTRTLFAVALAVLILGTAAAVSYAQGLDLIGPGAAKPTMQVMIGLMLAPYSNLMPKDVGPVVGDWHRVLQSPIGPLTLIVTITEGEKGALRGDLSPPDQGPGKDSAPPPSATERHLAFTVRPAQISYDGEWVGRTALVRCFHPARDHAADFPTRPDARAARRRHKHFPVLADHLTRHGVAVLRYDDRGVGRSTGEFAAATSADFATDARAAVPEHPA